jgi:hypothetical protein
MGSGKSTTFRDFVNILEEVKNYQANGSMSAASETATPNTDGELASRSSGSDHFVFDFNFLRSVPLMGRDFRVPVGFREWDNLANDKIGKVKHFLSMGTSKSGNCEIASLTPDEALTIAISLIEYTKLCHGEVK